MFTAQKGLYENGANMSFDQCLSAVIDRYNGCSMTVLCAQGIPKLMGACLDAGDHKAECEASRGSFNDTHFGFRDCVEKGFTGKLKKVCGSAFSAFASYCNQKYFGQ